MKKVKLALADDHVVLRKGLALLLEKLDYEVTAECDNGKLLIEQLNTRNLPDIVLLDINMPVMDGYETAKWFTTNFPMIHVLCLTMYDNEYSVIRMIRNGARGYIIKDADPSELKRAVSDIIRSGVHYSDRVTGNLLHSILNEKEFGIEGTVSNLSSREIEFLKLAGAEMSYSEIAAKMHLSPRTIDGYRDNLFEKLHVKNRIGLVLFAIRHKIITVN